MSDSSQVDPKEALEYNNVTEKSIPPSILFKCDQLGSTVRLRLRISISGNNFQNTRIFANNDFQYPRDVINSV